MSVQAQRGVMTRTDRPNLVLKVLLSSPTHRVMSVGINGQATLGQRNEDAGDASLWVIK